MNKQMSEFACLLALVLALAACGSVQAGLMNAEPPAYEQAAADYMQAAPNSYDPRYYQPQAEAYEALEQQALNQAAQQQQPQPQQQGAPAGRRITGHLRELGLSGLGSAQRAYQDAKPALNNIRGDLDEMAQRIKQNPHVAKMVQATRPHVMNVVNRAQPFVAGSGKKLGDLAGRAQQAIQARLAARQAARQQQQQNLAPGSVFPVPPPAMGGQF